MFFFSTIIGNIVILNPDYALEVKVNYLAKAISKMR
jgi:hypothetical protein